MIKTKINIIIGKFLESYFIESLLKLFDRKNFINFKGSLIFVKDLDHKNYIRILFSYYESAEIKLMNKYFKPDIITIDIGSGIGATMCTFAQKAKKKIICIEASKFCINQLKINFKKNKLKNFVIINKLFFARKNINNQKITFKENKDFTHNKLIKDNTDTKKNITNNNAVTLNKIIKKFALKHVQILCDIEGEEINFTKKDFEDFRLCQNLIIEIHTQNKVKINYLLKNFKMIASLQLVERKNSVFYLKKF